MIVRAFLDGLKRTVSAPALFIGVFMVTFLMALPLALTLRGMIQSQLGSSLAAGQLAEGFHYDWFEEFWSQAAGLGTTFTPSVIGFAATLDNLDGILDGQAEITPVASVLGVYLLVWTFLAGGIVDRYARQRPTRAHGFFAASGVFFLRFLRLAAFAGVSYYVLYAYVHGWLFEDLARSVTEDVAVERTAFVWRLALYAAFGVLLVLVNVLFDYAKIRAVVEDRRSMLFALLASARFMRRHPRQVFGLYALNALVFLVVLGAWFLVAPGARGSGVALWAGFILAQLYIGARLFVKLHVLASQTALFQGLLAHAAYTAAPAATWPESPAAETLARVHRSAQGEGAPAS
jgi:hypothetical protein